MPEQHEHEREHVEYNEQPAIEYNDLLQQLAALRLENEQLRREKET